MPDLVGFPRHDAKPRGVRSCGLFYNSCHSNASQCRARSEKNAALPFKSVLLDASLSYAFRFRSVYSITIIRKPPFSCPSSLK